MPPTHRTEPSHPQASIERRSDALTRAIYATDASIYEITPDAVAFPRSADDVRQLVVEAAAKGEAITPRGAGTGLTGGAINRGTIVDCSRHMSRIIEIDPRRRWVRVAPGVVLDELNAELAPLGLYFAPDVATSSRATIGGMIANNSCGAHSVSIGRTRDHLRAVEVVLGAGELASFGVDELGARIGVDSAARGAKTGGTPVPPGTSSNSRAGECIHLVDRITRKLHDEIAARYPRILRVNGGYALDRARSAQGEIALEQIICGSEGTLGIVTSATLNLLPVSKCRGLVLVHYRGLFDALRDVPALLRESVAALELIDRRILAAARDNSRFRDRWELFDDDPAAVLVAEVQADATPARDELLKRIEAIARESNTPFRVDKLTDEAQQAAVWDTRKAGLGLLMSRPGDRQPIAFVEDAAVEPARLCEYIRQAAAIFESEGVEQAGYYAHASVGLLHVRPVLNLKDAGDVARMQRIADRISSLVFKFGGAMTGEHGDGLVRSAWLHKQYGPRILHAFREIKRAFDPAGVLNPGKIIDTPPMAANLRYGPRYRVSLPQMRLDFGEHGGMAGLAEMCSGVGACRKTREGTMCPSYMATRDETHTTRARANALRVALSDRGVLDGLDDPALREVFDLCLSCKTCKTECPTGTDVAKLKSEWLHQTQQSRGTAWRSRLLAAFARNAGRLAPFAPVLNLIGRTGVARWLLERVAGLDRRMPLPRLARRTLRMWFAGRAADQNDQSRAKSGTEVRPRVALFVDTWTNAFTPEVGIAAVDVLESLGYGVELAANGCCGRPLISMGLLDEAAALADANVAHLRDIGGNERPLVVIEPSCASAMVDEFPQLARDRDAAGAIAKQVQTLEQFIARHVSAHGALPLVHSVPAVRYHGHCHQKALFGADEVVQVLYAATEGHATLIDAGCCGMAGLFGHEHYDVGRAVGEDRLFPAVRECGAATIAVSGFSCREQIAHHTGARPRHWIELLAEAMEPQSLS